MFTNNFDKYYTPEYLDIYCIQKFNQTFPDCTHIIEPSAGNGAFSKCLDNCIAYDIKPESDEIIECDFLKLEIPYRKYRGILGNPPFGINGELAIRFLNKSILIADFIGFILPIFLVSFKIGNKIPFNFVSSLDIGKHCFKWFSTLLF
ncbi:MAG: hypothetical protein PHR52_09440 [Fermentimonas sp.]|nr:hypothetical protein [Dysgonamonadaceae bacterium]MDD4697744.1 hypothetical protein [Fermentimonas sp.]